MKSLLYSIPPEVCERIANGKQTILLTKRLPKIDTPCKVYMYCAKGNSSLVYSTDPEDIAWCRPHIDIANNRVWTTHSGKLRNLCKDREWNGKVCGEFIWRGVMHPNDSIKLMAKQSCLSENDLDKYARGKTPYGLRITELEIYDKPKELSEFRGTKICPDWENDDTFDNTENCYNCDYYIGCDGHLPLTRPPATYCYVESLQ